ncbi:MAG: YkgJ family cysteine cluster protein [Acidobacteria bacterium]|nr:YkgJ family cysteine cluster protein [Acidobacteriota bacterium]
MPTRFLNEEQILQGAPRMGPEDRFRFRCDAALDCFTHCCRDVSIVLTPYDIIRMKRALGIDSSEFLEKYTISPFTAEQKFPIILLRMEGESRRCPFVGEKGCGIYAGRPWACRMYPLGVAAPQNPNPADHAFHFLVREDLCHGHDLGEGCTVREWLDAQGIEEYDMMGAPYRDLTLHSFWDGGQPLTPEQVGMFHMACYDPDRFRRFVFETRFLTLFEVDEARVEALRKDDLELFEFGVQWLRFSLFREKTMKLRGSVLEARQK